MAPRTWEAPDSDDTGAFPHLVAAVKREDWAMAVNPDKPWRLEDMKFQDEGGKRRGVMGGAQGRSWIGKRNA